MDFPQTQLQKQTEHFQPMLHFHVTTTPISYFPLKKKIWMKNFDSEVPLQSFRVRKGSRLFLPQLPSWNWLPGQACSVETTQLRKCLSVSRLIISDIQKAKADAFTQLRIAEVTIIYHVVIFILYLTIIFLLWQELTYHFPYGQKVLDFG